EQQKGGGSTENSLSAVPTETNTIAEIKAYLDSKKISYPSTANKADLLALIPKTE
ncbi:HeH/LEM domain-containing protein, partial [Streptococcus anginosus]|uniref:HeH/LEM domain-containing protein n=1 Tax=Streptococcus anginosus TaxID=1328 RepID=UPI0021F853A1